MNAECLLDCVPVLRQRKTKLESRETNSRFDGLSLTLPSEEFRCGPAYILILRCQINHYLQSECMAMDVIDVILMLTFEQGKRKEIKDRDPTNQFANNSSNCYRHTINGDFECTTEFLSGGFWLFIYIKRTLCR